MRGRLVLPLVLAVAALAAGCGGNDEAQPGAPTAEPPTPTTGPAETETEAEPERTILRVYLMRGEKLGVGSRSVAATEAIGRAALEELLAGPTELDQAAGLGSEVPDGARLLGLTIDEGHALVDLSREFEAGGGSLSMQARVAQVVYTLTQFPSVDRVTIRLDGEEVDGIGGEGVPAADLTRADFEGVTPQILVEAPAPGEQVTSPLRIQGTANTFEATFMVNVTDPDGRVVVEDFVTATSGSGGRGTFDASFTFDVSGGGTGALIVFEVSAQDGSRTNLVEIPIELMP